MIEIQHEKGKTVVMAICDKCRKEIIDAEKGLVLWKFDEGPINYILAHKGSCDDRRYQCSMELNTFLFYLLHNTGMTKEKLREAKRRATFLSAI